MQLRLMFMAVFICVLTPVYAHAKGQAEIITSECMESLEGDWPLKSCKCLGDGTEDKDFNKQEVGLILAMLKDSDEAEQLMRAMPMDRYIEVAGYVSESIMACAPEIDEYEDEYEDGY